MEDGDGLEIRQDTDLARKARQDGQARCAAQRGAARQGERGGHDHRRVRVLTEPVAGVAKVPAAFPGAMAAGRYVDDVPYARAFIPHTAPAWLDFTAALNGLAPPARQGGFAWCDLGCGQGVTAVVLAATHPEGQFHGIDAMAAHVDHGRRLAAAAGAANAHFHAVDFGMALGLDLPQFDYIAAHGVYSWVDDRARADLLAFIAARLKPGGLAYVSYNARPGRTADQPFQELMLALAGGYPGDSIEKTAAAAGFARKLRRLKTPALTASPMADLLLGARARSDWSYMAHELMNPQWRPASVLELRRAMAGIGLSPAGSATLMDNFDSYRLGAAPRRLLGRIADHNLRDLVRDYMVDQSFRRDVFAAQPKMLDGAEQLSRLRAAPLALAARPGSLGYRMQTPGGEVGFDTPAARRIARALTAGPRPLATLRGNPDDLLASGLALLASGLVWPVEGGAGAAGAGRFNRAAAERWGGQDALGVFAVGCGTALQPPPKVAAALHAGAGGAWRRRLAANGAGLG